MIFDYNVLSPLKASFYIVISVDVTTSAFKVERQRTWTEITGYKYFRLIIPHCKCCHLLLLGLKYAPVFFRSFLIEKSHLRASWYFRHLLQPIIASSSWYFLARLMIPSSRNSLCSFVNYFATNLQCLGIHLWKPCTFCSFEQYCRKLSLHLRLAQPSFINTSLSSIAHIFSLSLRGHKLYLACL